MGRGLAAILSISSDDGAGPELRDVAVELIEPNPAQPRRRFDEESLEALAGSLRERAALAGGEARRARPDPGARASSRRRRVARGGAGREHGPRGPQPGGGGT